MANTQKEISFIHVMDFNIKP